jgi:hypothetical protein
MLQSLKDVWRWCAVESVFLGLAFGASVFVVVVAMGVCHVLKYILRFLLTVSRFVWRLCITVRTLYMGLFHPKTLLNEIECAIHESDKPHPEMQQALDKILSEHRKKSRGAVIDLTSPEDTVIDLAVPEESIRERVKAEVHRYHMSREFRDVVMSHVTAIRDTKSGEEQHFENQEKTREETAWYKLYVENRASFYKVSKKLTEDVREIEETRIDGFELGFGKDDVVKEVDWTISQKIHFAKRFVIDAFGSDVLPVEIDAIANSNTDEEYSTNITHVNTVVLCGRIYVETIDNWNNRAHYDPSEYSSMVIYTNNNIGGHMSDGAWSMLHEKDRAERRARLAEDVQYAQDLAEAIEADRVVARDNAILMNVRAHRSGKTYAH